MTPPEPTTAWSSEAGADEPRMQLAESLEAAGARTFVYVDDSGRVQPAWRYRLLQIGSWSALIVLTAISGAVLTWLGGLVGLAIGLGLAALIAHLALVSSWLHRGVVLLAHDRLDAADVLLERARRFSLFHLGIRALALQNRSAVAQRRGDHGVAHALGARALALREKLPGSFGRGLHYWLSRYSQIIVLCNLGQTSEARAELGRIREAPPGEYIRLRHWTAELYLALCSGVLELDRAELELRTERAVELHSSPELLALCAWAWLAIGEREIADRHLETALALTDAAPFAQSLPALSAWMNAHVDDAKSSAPDPPGDP